MPMKATGAALQDTLIGQGPPPKAGGGLVTQRYRRFSSGV